MLWTPWSSFPVGGFAGLTRETSRAERRER